jgi:hypothetical protein
MIAAVASLTMEELLKSEPSNLHKGPVIGPDGIQGIAQAPYLPDTLKWLSIGTMYDHPKSWTFMGGGVAPGEGAVILYMLDIQGKKYYPDEFASDRKTQISWYYRDGYQPCPVSIWRAEGVEVTIQHFAVRHPADNSTLIYSQVKLVNKGNSKVAPSLLINAGPRIHLPLTKEPSVSGNTSMEFKNKMEPGEEVLLDFVSHAAGAGIDPDQKDVYGTFDDNYRRMKADNDQHIQKLAHPVTLPNQGIADMYKAIQIMLWNYAVERDGECQIRSNAGNPARIQSYDRPFPHDVPNFVDQFIREGDYELGKKILKSDTYRKMNTSDIKDWDDLNYMDTIGKFMLPYAQYLQNTGDKEFFDSDMLQFLKEAARNIHKFRIFDDPEHIGLMKKGEDFENWSDDGDYLLADNWAALHGLQAYCYIVTRLCDEEEIQWVNEEMKSLNDAVNDAIERAMARRDMDYYLGAFDDVAYQRYIAGSFYSWVPYSAALATFPWGAELKGYKLGGVWKDKFDAAINYAVEQRNLRMIPDGSWGAWWSKVTYGSVYNAAAGVQCLFSDKYRTEALKNVEFLYENQCAPFVWSEAFESKGKHEWAGMYLPQESYGNYEAWGSSFTKQAILQACVSVQADGSVILGRGILDSWLKPGDCIAWENVNINNGRTFNFSIVSRGNEIDLEMNGDEPEGEVILDLPIMKDNVEYATEGEVQASGSVRIKGNVSKLTVRLKQGIEE